MGSETWRGDRGPPMTELGDRPGMGFVAPHCGPVMPAFLADAALLCLRCVHVFRLCWVFPAVQAFSSCGAGGSHCGRLPSCRAQALERRLSSFVTGLSCP